MCVLKSLLFLLPMTLLFFRSIVKLWRRISILSTSDINSSMGILSRRKQKNITNFVSSQRATFPPSKSSIEFDDEDESSLCQIWAVWFTAERWKHWTFKIEFPRVACVRARLVVPYSFSDQSIESAQSQEIIQSYFCCRQPANPSKTDLRFPWYLHLLEIHTDTKLGSQSTFFRCDSIS